MSNFYYYIEKLVNCLRYGDDIFYVSILVRFVVEFVGVGGFEGDGEVFIRFV